MFSKKVELDAVMHAEQCYPNESCGLVVDGKYIACENVHESPEKAFSIRRDVISRHAGLIDSVIHSHPDGPYYPSCSDMRGQISWDVPWGIVHVDQGVGRAPFYWGGSTPIPELIGRPFQHGITDCYSYVRDYFRLKRDIVLDEFPRDWDWWLNGDNLYSDNFRSQGFIVINNSDVKEGDVFLAQFGNTPVINHAGVYEGSGLIGHQPGDHRSGYSSSLLSRRSPVNIYKRSIRFWLRYDPNSL